MIASDPKSGRSPISIDEFKNKVCPVMEFGADGCVLALDPQGRALATFDKEDVKRSFRCLRVGEFVCPPGLNVMEQMHYSFRCRTRKGGYSPILANMVIAASLAKGEFCDSFLWA